MVKVSERIWSLYKFAPIHLELSPEFHCFFIVSTYFENVSDKLESNKIPLTNYLLVFWLLAHIPGPAPNAVELANPTGKKEKRSALRRDKTF